MINWGKKKKGGMNGLAKNIENPLSKKMVPGGWGGVGQNSQSDNIMGKGTEASSRGAYSSIIRGGEG